MLKNTKIAVISSTLLVPAIFLLADDDCLDSCCPPRDACAKCAQIWPTCGPSWMITPDAGPCVSKGWDAHLGVEFIYWTAREDHLAFAFKEPFQNAVGVTGKGRTYHPDWNFEPGFKIEFGVLQDHDGWDVTANYTWLRVRNTKNRVDSDDPLTGSIEPIGGFPAGGGLVEIEKMAARWQLDFNVVDLVLGRNFFISNCLTFRPNFGLKGTWQDQNYKVHTIGAFENTPSVGQNKDQLDYWGVGIRAGLDSAWHITRALSFLGEVAISALWERFIVDSKSSNAPIDIGASEPFVILNLENRFFTIKPVLELFLGFRWETWFCCDTYHFSFDGGWEEQWWSDQNQFFDPFLESKQGDLFLQGLTLKARIDF